MLSEKEIVNIIVEFIRKETGYTKEATFGIGYDEFTIRTQEKLDNARIRIIFKHFFEEDGFSQYPKTHELEGFFLLDHDGKILDWYMEEIYTGPGSTLGPYKNVNYKDFD